MTAHTERAHAKLSPSASHRWMECPGSIKLSEGIESSSSVFADEGSAAHELAAHCLNTGFDPARFLNYVVDIKAKSASLRFLMPGTPVDNDIGRFEVDEEMVESVDLYVNYVKAQVEPGDEIEIEYRFDLQHVADGMFGTGDAVVYKVKTGQLIVADFKYGRGVAVEPDSNPQLLSYGLGAIKRHGNRPLMSITLAIVQPRAAHAKGSIREWTTDAMDLLEFENVLREAAAATEAPDAPLKPGEWCRFCPAAAICPALRAKANAIATQGFTEMAEPEKMSPAALAEILAEIPILTGWASRVMAYAHDQAVAGNKIPGFKLVAKRATRKWRDESEAAGALQTMFEIPRSSLYVEEMISPAVCEKLMPGKNKEARARALDSYVTKQSSGAVLVPEDDKRPAISTSDGSEFLETEIPAA